jgi:hypothetical protein
VANATPRDTRAGFDIFRAEGGDLSLDDLNAQLYEAGYGPVAARTFTHYRHLVMAGFTRYISINRFDVARAAVPYEDSSSRARYSYERTDLGVRVVFAKASKLLETYGQATDIGEVGAILRFSETEVIEGLRKMKPAPGDMVSVRYLEEGRTVGGTVLESDLTGDTATVEIEFNRLVSIAAIGMGEPLPSEPAMFTLRGPGENDQALDVAGRRLYLFFELVEGLRSVANEAGARQPRQVYAAPPDLHRLSVASPAEILLGLASVVQDFVPWGLLYALMKGAWDLPAKRKEWLEGDGQREQNKILKADARLKELEADQSEREAAFRAEALARLREAFPSSTISDEVAQRALDRFVIEPASALGRTGITELGHEGDPAEDEGDEGPTEPEA